MFKEFVEFVQSLFNTKGFIPLHAPVFLGNEKKYVNECLDTTFVSSVGKFVSKFEEMVAEYTGAKHAVAVSNGTSALQVALMLAGVQPGDEVITQPLTFVATANAIKHVGAQPVFVDVDKETMGLSPEKLEYWLKNNTTTKRNNKSINQLFNKTTHNPISACVPMHTFGYPCKIDEITNICKDYNIPVVEDSAESLGSFYKGKHTGTYGLLGIFSFNGNKIITTGGGGMIITDNEELAKKAKHITTTGRVTHKWEYIHNIVAFNYRLPNLNAALGVAQMEQLETFVTNKRETAKKYKAFFKGSIIDFFSEPQNSHSNYWLNAILFENKKERNEFLKYTNENGIMTRPVWRLMNKLEMFKDCQTDDLTNAEWFEGRAVNIPSSVNFK